MNYDLFFARDVCDRWLAKAGDVAPIDVEQAFDIFFSLWVPYSRICTCAGNVLGGSPRGDRLLATRAFPQAVGYQRVWECLSTLDGMSDLAELAGLVGVEGRFALHHDWRGTPGLERDIDLRRKMRGVPPTDPVQGLLEYLYQVRCNLFHGSKDVVDGQMLIFGPSIRCLRRLSGCGRDWLEESWLNSD